MPWLGRVPRRRCGVPPEGRIRLSCVAAALVLAVSGFTYFVVRDVSAIGGSHAINSGPSVGAMNILVMGLESRTDYKGNVLPNDLLTAMHAGSRHGVRDGRRRPGHEHADPDPHPRRRARRRSASRSRATTRSPSPRPTTGRPRGRSTRPTATPSPSRSLRSGSNPNMSQSQVACRPTRRARRPPSPPWSRCTGEQIDHFAEVNLAGFYYLAQAFGGIEVCLKPSRQRQPARLQLRLQRGHDGYSVSKGGAQYLHLKAPQALAFVRERDDLPNGDLDRTHRQQAVLDYVIWKLETTACSATSASSTRLLSTAKQYLITDAGWNLLDFATDMRSADREDLQFYTLPIESYITSREPGREPDQRARHPGGHQDDVHPAPSGRSRRAAAQVRARTVSPVRAAATTVDVYNGGQTAGLAAGRSPRRSRQGRVHGRRSHERLGAVAAAPRAPRCSTAPARRRTRRKIAALFGVTATASCRGGGRATSR